MNEFDLIVGIHSIVAALNNEHRVIRELVLTDEGEEELIKRGPFSKNKLKELPVRKVSGHKLQEEAKTYFREKKLEYQRVPSQVFLIADQLPVIEMNEFYQSIKKDNFRLLCLDQISDVHNAGAIIRTASFYGVDTIILPGKKSFGLTPSFFRIASGAAEYVKIISVTNLSKVIKKLNDEGFTTVGLSEHSTNPLTQSLIEDNKKLCLVLGKEDTGISNAVMRQVTYQLSLTTQGNIKSLNVSSAAAIAMEKCFK